MTARAADLYPTIQAQPPSSERRTQGHAHHRPHPGAPVRGDGRDDEPHLVRRLSSTARRLSVVHVDGRTPGWLPVTSGAGAMGAALGVSRATPRAPARSHDAARTDYFRRNAVRRLPRLTRRRSPRPSRARRGDVQLSSFNSELSAPRRHCARGASSALRGAADPREASRRKVLWRQRRARVRPLRRPSGWAGSASRSHAKAPRARARRAAPR
jgi:hypothetical protein